MKKSLLLVTAGLLLSSNCFALQNTVTPLPPRVSLWGTTGDNTFGEGDAMIPLISNCNQSFYTDVTSKYGRDDSWLGSIGLGDRTIVYNSTILGAYFFGDYNRTVNGNYFPVLNPGLEFMTNQWDGHLNGYFPTGDQSKLVSALTASQAGMPNTAIFTGHDEFAPLYDERENVGPGTDLEIGNTFSSLNRTRFFAGGYFFDPKYTSHVKGVEGGFELPLYHQRIFADVRDSYDNIYHNTFTISLRITFGGLNKTNCPDVHDRMLDLIPRHLGALNVGDGIPSPTKVLNLGRRTLVQDNIWFFIPGANGSITAIRGFGDATFENPAQGLAQSQLDSINALSPNAILYFNSGTYNNPEVGNGYSFHPGQTVDGRTNYFAQEAAGATRPLFNDTFILNGNNSVNDLQIDGNTVTTIQDGITNPSAETGIVIPQTATGNINIDDAAVTTTSTTNNVVAVVSGSNLASVLITDSSVRSNILGTGSFNIGLDNLGLGRIRLSNSLVNSTTSKSANNSVSLTDGIVNNSLGTIDIINSPVAVATNNSGASNIDTAIGISNSLGAVNLTGSAVSVNATNTGAGSLETATGYTSSGLGTSTLSNSSISVNSSVIGGTSNTVKGLVNGGLGVINFNNSSLTALSSNDVGGILKNNTGLLNSSKGTINVTNSSITTNLINGLTTASLSNTGGGTMNLSNSTVFSLGTNVIILSGINNAGTNSNINVTGTAINLTGNNAANTIGASTTANSTIAINNSQINLTANSGSKVGLSASGAGAKIIFGSSILTMMSTGGAAPITSEGTGGGTVVRSGSSCYINGVLQLSC